VRVPPWRETGVALELMAKGTKYFKDSDLNR
jgi:hypothetical protein